MPIKMNPFQQLPSGRSQEAVVPSSALISLVGNTLGDGAASRSGVWEVSMHPADTRTPSWRIEFLDKLRPALAERLRKNPHARDIELKTVLGSVQVRLREGQSGLNVPMQFVFASHTPMPFTSQTSIPFASHAVGSHAEPEIGADSPPLTALHFPDDNTCALGQRLVGLETAREEVLLLWGLQWDGALEAWSRRTEQPVPPALRAHLQEAHGLTVFFGDPGTGKSALARVIGDTYCRTHGIAGTALFVTTAARGEGLVGQFSQRLRSAFHQLLSLPEGSLRLLVIDEADALAVRRSEAQAHQEDRAATASLLQLLDAVAGLPRTAIIATTNRLDALDPALLRRAHCIGFERPGQAARETLLTSWVPQASPKDIANIAVAADQLTPADIEGVMLRVWKGVIGQGAALTVAGVASVLRAAPRTQSV